MTSKRFLMVPELSSAARIPLPFATIAFAVLTNPSLSIALPYCPTPLQCGYAWERTALQPFQKRAASGGNIAEIVRHARVVQCRDRVAAPVNRKQTPFACR